MKLGEAMYKSSQAEQAGAAPGGPGGSDGTGPQGEKVVDAEFEEVDPDQHKKAG